MGGGSDPLPASVALRPAKESPVPCEQEVWWAPVMAWILWRGDHGLGPVGDWTKIPYEHPKITTPTELSQLPCDFHTTFFLEDTNYTIRKWHAVRNSASCTKLLHWQKCDNKQTEHLRGTPNEMSSPHQPHRQVHNMQNFFIITPIPLMLSI
jgi:hypothetical protein